MQFRVSCCILCNFCCVFVLFYNSLHTVAEKCDCTVAEKWDCLTKVRVSQKRETVAEKWDCLTKVQLSPNFAVFCDSLTFVRRSHFSATVSLLCDSLTFLRQCGQGLKRLWPAIIVLLYMVTWPPGLVRHCKMQRPFILFLILIFAA